MVQQKTNKRQVDSSIHNYQKTHAGEYRTEPSLTENNSNAPLQNKISYNNIEIMNRNNLVRELLSDLSIEDLQRLVTLKRELKPIPTQRKQLRKPIPTPRRVLPRSTVNVKQMVKNYEDNIISPPIEFRDDYKPTPTPRIKNQQPIPAKRSQFKQTANALKGFTKSILISIKNTQDPLIQMQNTRLAVEHYLKNELIQMKGLKFVQTLKVTFVKQKDDNFIYNRAYFNSQPQTVINDNEIAEALQLTQQ